MLDEYNERLRGREARAKSSNTRRIDRVESRQDDLEKLASSLRVFATEQEHIKTDVREIKADVKSLTNKPARRWEMLLEKGVGTIAAALAGYLLARIGLL